MGAQWIHGTKKNPIFELSKSLGLLDDKKSNFLFNLCLVKIKKSHVNSIIDFS